MKNKILIGSLSIVLIGLTGFVSYYKGHHDGAEAASIYFSAHVMYDNAGIALRIASGEGEKVMKDLEVTFLQFPEVKKWVENDPIHFGEKIDLHLAEHYIRKYYETRGEEVPKKILDE